MPNKNYLAGRRLEYDCMKRWIKKDYAVVRTSGSHGLYDVIAFRTDRKAEFIQCKRVSTEAEANRLLNSFKSTTMGSSFYHQVMEVKIKGSRGIMSVTV